ncbi:MAG: hypothetical protein AB1941_27045 [Gemmatimonadota bacterium]
MSNAIPPDPAAPAAPTPDVAVDVALAEGARTVAVPGRIAALLQQAATPAQLPGALELVALLFARLDWYQAVAGVTRWLREEPATLVGASPELRQRIALDPASIPRIAAPG